ncbi:MAG: glycosyltransferase family 2 protein [Chitinophagia bacterium]|nr:glycosyltransferase family 2 protein [Chitinophagia bacterium]
MCMKYFTYFSKFINSDKKGELISLLYLQIKDKGLIRGAQELLHIKSGGGNTDELSREQFQYKDYDSSQAIELPVPPMPLVSIVIPVYNNLEATYNCIRSIYENTATPNYEVIIADDASPTNMAVLQDMCKNCIYIKNSVNLGYLRNCNNAAKSARGTYLVLLNNDTQVQAGWLEELLYVFNNFPDAGLVGGMLIYPEVLLQEAGGIIWKDGSGCNYGNRDNVNGGAYNYIKEADYVSGASYMITKALWEVIGGYDERYAPAYHEDSDLCFEVRRRGKKVYYTPFSKVMHEEGLSHGKSLKQGLKKYQVINKKKFIEKWGDELKEKSAKDKNVFIERERGHGKKYVLIIDHNVPTVDKDAGSRTINNIVNTLLGMGYQVKFMVPNIFTR